METLSLGPVQLRVMVEDDLETVRTWRNSPEVSEYMYSTAKISAEDQLRWYERVRKDPEYQYWIISYDGEPMGVANLAAINSTHSRCDWAFYLGNPEARGKGIGGSVEYLVLNHVFRTLKLRKLCCEVLVSNPAVIRLHEKFGFQVEGNRRRHIQRNGEFLDIVEMGLLSEEWELLEPAMLEKLNRSRK